MSLPGSDLSLTPEIALNGTYEESELRFLDRILKGGDVFVDVGCNVGVFSLVACQKVGPFGRVYAFDINPLVLEHLNRSLVINWMHDRCVVMQNAVGDHPQKVKFRFSAKRLGDGNIGLGSDSVFQTSIGMLGEINEGEVAQVRLDDVFPFDQEIKVLKIDVEGFEHLVIGGAKRLVTGQCINYILMELLEEVAAGRHGKNMDAVNWVLSQGYRLCSVLEDGSTKLAGMQIATRKTDRNILLERVPRFS